MDIAGDTHDRTVLDLQTIESFRYWNPGENPDIIVRFRRSWHDNMLQDHIWLATATNRKGEHVAAKPVSAAYASDLLNRYREHVEIAYRG